MDRTPPTRRAVLGGLAGLGTASLAGCSGLFERQSIGNPPVVEDRPNAVYYPSHIEGMAMIGTEQVGDRTIGLMYSYAHRFWTMNVGATTERVSPSGDAHLMVSVWDGESGRVLPIRSGLSVTIEQDGEEVDSRTPWTMLSQNMGFHYGDNVGLNGDGTYTVTVETGGLSIDRLGEFSERFSDPATAEFEWEFSQSARGEIVFRQLDNAGETGAVSPMSDMMMPLSIAPAEGDVPGRVLATGESGNATFVATTAERDGSQYLAISPRTPHNRYVLPQMALSATLTRGDETVFEGPLSPAIGPRRGYHYGTAIDGSLELGDGLTITVDSPPQISRHEGYETAFLSMSDLSLTVE